MARLVTDGATIDYRTGGRGAPLVLIHGSWDDRSVWELVRPALELGFRTISYSRRGNGLSTGGGTLDDDVRDLAALIEHLELAPAHLAGSSLGATVCLRLAASRPDLVASINAHEPPLFGLLAGDPTWQADIEQLQRRLEGVLALIGQDRTAEAAERFCDDIALGAGAWAALLEDERRMLIRHAGTFAEEIGEAGIFTLEVASLAAVATPVLLTGGAASPALFQPVLDRLAAVLPRVQRHQFAEAGHVPHLTHPDEYCDMVKQFASAIGRAGQADTSTAEAVEQMVSVLLPRTSNG